MLAWCLRVLVTKLHFEQSVSREVSFLPLGPLAFLELKCLLTGAVECWSTKLLRGHTTRDTILMKHVQSHNLNNIFDVSLICPWQDPNCSHRLLWLTFWDRRTLLDTTLARVF